MSDRITFAATVNAEGRRLKGSVVLAGSRTFRDGEWVEVDPVALMKADASDVFARFDHEPSQVLGRTKNGTLTVNRTEQGIEWETADLPNTTAANDALELARGGYVAGSSFTIDGIRSKFSVNPDDGIRVRTINSIKRLVDVAPVQDPAFENSTASAFSKENEVTEATQPVEPQAPPAPPRAEAPTAQFKQEPSGPDWNTIAGQLPTNQIENGMNSIMAESKGNPTPEQNAMYSAFAAEYAKRKTADAQERSRHEAFTMQHKALLGQFEKAPESEVLGSDDYKAAFDKYLRSGVETFAMNTANMAQFAQTIAGDGSQGGFMVPDGFVAKLGERLKAFGGIARVADEITTSTGESLRWPYIDDTANEAEIVAEDTQASSGADLVFDSVELGAFEYDATGASGNPIEISLPLLQDAAFDVEDRLEGLLGKRIGRKQARNFANGNGGTEPVGLFAKTADTMTATVASLAAVEHVLQVDSEYRDNEQCYWVMSDTTLAKLWGAQATTNEPLFIPNRTINGKPFDTVMGYPIVIDPAAGTKVAFGAIRAGYIIRRVRGVQLLVDPYTAQKRRAVQYHAWARADGQIQDPNAYSVSDWSGVSADT